MEKRFFSRVRNVKNGLASSEARQNPNSVNKSTKLSNAPNLYLNILQMLWIWQKIIFSNTTPKYWQILVDEEIILHLISSISRQIKNLEIVIWTKICSRRITLLLPVSCDY